MWWLLGTTDVLLRYSRSRLGQFWITLSIAIFIGGIGYVNSQLFRTPIADYLPYLCVNFIVWTFISGVVNDAGGVFTSATSLLRQQAMSKSLLVLRTLVKNAVILAHNVLIIPLVFLAFGVGIGPAALLAIPGLVLLTLAAFFVVLLLGILSTRFRDLPNITQNVMQIAFFVTPVMWKPTQLGDNHPVVLLNPLALYLQLVSGPLLGHPPTVLQWLLAVGLLAILAAATVVVFSRFRARIVYWL